MKTSEKLYAQAEKLRDRAFVAECAEELARLAPRLRELADKLGNMSASAQRHPLLSDRLKRLDNVCTDIEYFLLPVDGK